MPWLGRPGAIPGAKSATVIVVAAFRQRSEDLLSVAIHFQ
jgi:hypothetical protein